MKIAKGVYHVGGDGLSAPGDAAVYCVVFEPAAALIDAGTGRGHQALVRSIDQCLRPNRVALTHLLLTHCHFDHTGGAALLRKHYGCRIVAHEQDARFLESGDNRVTAADWYNASLAPLTIDHRIHGAAERLQIGTGLIEALHCPGHSPGSTAYLLETEGFTVLFGQDIHGPLHPDLLSNRDDYIASLTMLLRLDADILCEGHFGVIRGRDNVRAFIQSYIR